MVLAAVAAGAAGLAGCVTAPYPGYGAGYGAGYAAGSSAYGNSYGGTTYSTTPYANGYDNTYSNGYNGSYDPSAPQPNPQQPYPSQQPAPVYSQPQPNYSPYPSSGEPAYQAPADNRYGVIERIDAVCRTVQAKHRRRKRQLLCFDEWNVWYKNTEMDGAGTHAPHRDQSRAQGHDGTQAEVGGGFGPCDWDYDCVTEWVMPDEEAFNEINRIFADPVIGKIFHDDEEAPADGWHEQHY